MQVARSVQSATFAVDLVLALVAPALALGAAEFLYSTLGLTRTGILFLAAVTFAASLRGTRAAVLAALIGVLCYKLFLDQRAGESTSAVEDLLAVLVFLVVALVTGTLAGRVHDSAEKARRHAAQMETLFRTSRALSEEEEGKFWPTLTGAIAQASGGAALAVDERGAVQARAGRPANEGAALDRARRILDGAGEPKGGGGEWRARTVPHNAPFAGVLLWEAREDDGETEGFTELLADLAAASLARAQMRREQVRVEAAEEAGKLREALLSSISHDFRSPLAAIIGSSTSLLEYGDKFDEAVRRDLLLNIQDEGEKLNQFVANLLNMTRLQSGVVRPATRALTAGDAIGSAIERLRRHHGGKTPAVELDADCTVQADPLLLEQAVYNILDNAAKYAGADGPVEIVCQNDGAFSRIVISDHGPGLPPEDQAGIFTTFHFARKGQAKGTGLGLSISRGFIEAMGGTIAARDRSDGQSGLEIAINLPRSSA
jgi:two-component system sensor histidine kinase KdpD